MSIRCDELSGQERKNSFQTFLRAVSVSRAGLLSATLAKKQKVLSKASIPAGVYVENLSESHQNSYFVCAFLPTSKSVVDVYIAWRS